MEKVIQPSTQPVNQTPAKPVTPPVAASVSEATQKSSTDWYFSGGYLNPLNYPAWMFGYTTARQPAENITKPVTPKIETPEEPEWVVKLDCTPIIIEPGSSPVIEPKSLEVPKPIVIDKSTEAPKSIVIDESRVAPKPILFNAPSGSNNHNKPVIVSTVLNEGAFEPSIVGKPIAKSYAKPFRKPLSPQLNLGRKSVYTQTDLVPAKSSKHRWKKFRK